MQITQIQQSEDDVVGKTLDHVVDSFFEPSAKAKMSAEVLITYKCLIEEDEPIAAIDCFLQDLKDEADDRFALDVVDFELKTIGLEGISFEGNTPAFTFDTEENSDRYSDILLHVAAVLYCTNSRRFLDTPQSGQLIH